MTGGYRFCITLTHPIEGKKPEILTIVETGERKMLYFRQGMGTVFSMETDREQLCMDVFVYLQNGFEIQYMSEECCARLWEEIMGGFTKKYRELQAGEQLFLTYCSDYGYSLEFLQESVDGQVPDAMQKWAGRHEIGTRPESTPQIPEWMGLGTGFTDGVYPDDLPEAETRPVAKFIRECHVQLYVRRWEEFEYIFVMTKQGGDGKVDVQAAISDGEELAFFKKGRPPENIPQQGVPLSFFFLRYLKAGYHIVYMSAAAHGTVWKELAKRRPEYLRPYGVQIQDYAGYCRKHGITKNRLSRKLGKEVADFMGMYSLEGGKNERMTLPLQQPC